MRFEVKAICWYAKAEMIETVRRWSNPIFLTIAVALAQKMVLAGDEWQIIKVNGGRIETVVLDAGHGGHDKGQVSRYGCEKDFALDVARKLRPVLQAKGLRVIMTREGDYFVPLEVRANIANAARNSIFVSIHFNATNDNPNATGFEIFSFTPRGAPSTSDSAVALSSFNMQPGSEVDAQSMALSACIYHSLLGHITEYDRGIKRARFAVLRLT